MKWSIGEGYIFLAQHMQRMKNSASYFSWEIDSKKIESALVKAVQKFGQVDQRVRVQVSKSGEITIENSDFVDLPNPYRIKVALKPVNSRNYFLYHKTTHRNMYEKAFSELHHCDDALLWNENGEFTESCRANLLIENSNGWFTPPVSCGLLNGIGRQDLIDRGEVQESVINIDQLRSVKSVWLVNSVRERWPVTLIS